MTVCLIQRVVYLLIQQVHTKGTRLVILFFFVYSIILLSYDMKTFTVMVNNINKPKNCPRFLYTEKKITYGAGDPSIDLIRGQTCSVLKQVNEFTNIPL